MGNRDVRDFWEDLGTQYRRASTADANDRLGYKNAYIGELRDRCILHELRHTPAGAVIADLGCGEGGLTRTLSQAGYAAIGLDITDSLLRLAREYNGAPAGAPSYLRFDGTHLPLSAESLGAVVIFEVLMYLDAVQLPTLLSEIRRVLAPSGVLILIEQCRRKAYHDTDRHKWQHARRDWQAELESAGFIIGKQEIRRHGHFPLTYLIRFGWFPRRWWGHARRLERRLGRWIGILPGDYADVLFVVHPRRDEVPRAPA